MPFFELRTYPIKLGQLADFVKFVDDVIIPDQVWWLLDRSLTNMSGFAGLKVKQSVKSGMKPSIRVTTGAMVG